MREKIFVAIKNFVNIGYSLIFLILAVKMLINTQNILKTLALATMFVFVSWGVPKLLNKMKNSGTVKLLLLVLFAVLQMIFFVTVAIPSSWDPFYIRLFAEYGVDSTITDYFAKWPNNTFIAMVVHIWVHVTGKIIPFVGAYKRMVMFNIIVVDTAVVATYICGKKLFGEKQADSLMTTAIMMIAVSPWMEVVYTDTLAAAFPILFVCFLTMFAVSPKSYAGFIYLFMAFFTAVIGINVKPTVAMVVIATAIAVMLGEKKIITKQFLKKAAVVCVACITALGIVKAVSRPIIQYNETYHPAEKARGLYYFLDTGLNSFGEGIWTIEVFGWHNDNINDPDYEQLAKDRIIKTIKSYGVKGMIEHSYKKLLFMGTDGTFWFGREGSFYSEDFADENTLKGKLQNYINVESLFYKNWLSVWQNAMWIVVCIQSIFAFRYKAKDEICDNIIFISKLAVGGLFLYLMIFENRSRYIFLYLPVMIMTAQTGALAIKQRLFKNK